MQRRTLLAGLLSVSIAAPLMSGTSFAKSPDTLRVALLPDENAATIIQNAKPLKDYLEKALSKKVEIVVTTDYSSMIEAMRFGRIEIGYFGPLSYVLAKSKAPNIEPFAVGVEKGKPSYASILIANAQGPVKSLADVKGLAFGFGDQASTSSHLAPRAHLAKNGLRGDIDYKPVHLGTHDSVARAVQAGQIPAGGLSEPIYRALVERKIVDPTKVVQIAISDQIPNYPITMQGDLDPELKAAIRKAFLDINDPAILKAFRVEGFAPTEDNSYDVLREMAKLLDLDLAKVK